MSWADLPKHERDQLASRLTERQLLVYILRLPYDEAIAAGRRPPEGTSWEYISNLANIQIRTCRTHYHAAKIVRQQIRQEAA